MRHKLIGRIAEQKVLGEALTTHKAELIAVIGRRRVGKTYLIESFFQDQIAFQISGIQGMSRKKQLRNFAAQLTKYTRQHHAFPIVIQAPTDWLDAILLLIDYLESIEDGTKRVVFFDELPWLATHKSGFLPAFSYFWNSWARQRNIIVVICGSAAAWMIKKVVHHKGGLHNRVTRQLSLAPFTQKFNHE